MPGPVVAVAIERLGSVGQQLNLMLASLLTALAVAALVHLAIRVGDQLRNRAVPVVLGAAFVWAVTALVTVDFASATGAAAGAALVVSTAGFLPVATARIERGPDPVRRRVIGGVAAALGLGTVALTRSSPSSRPDQPLSADVPEPIREKLDLASEHSLDVVGIEPLVSRDFYQVDINAADPGSTPTTGRSPSRARSNPWRRTRSTTSVRWTSAPSSRPCAVSATRSTARNSTTRSGPASRPIN